MKKTEYQSRIKYEPGERRRSRREKNVERKSLAVFMICIPNEGKSMHTFSAFGSELIYFLYFFPHSDSSISFIQYFYGYPYQIIFAESKLLTFCVCCLREPVFDIFCAFDATSICGADADSFTYVFLLKYTL